MVSPDFGFGFPADFHYCDSGNTFLTFSIWLFELSFISKEIVDSGEIW